MYFIWQLSGTMRILFGRHMYFIRQFLTAVRMLQNIVMVILWQVYVTKFCHGDSLSLKCATKIFRQPYTLILDYKRKQLASVL
jgi:hypothetical protein